MDYSGYTVRELRHLAEAELGAKAALLKTKAELIAALKAVEAAARVEGEAVPPRTVPEHGFNWTAGEIVDRDFFVEPGRVRPVFSGEENRVFAFVQDPSAIAISWQLKAETAALGAQLVLVGAQGEERAHPHPVTATTGFATFSAGAMGSSIRAQLRHPASAEVLATSAALALLSAPSKAAADALGAPKLSEAARVMPVPNPSSW